MTPFQFEIACWFYLETMVRVAFLEMADQFDTLEQSIQAARVHP